MKSQSKSGNYYVPALEKGLDIIETLSASEYPLSLSDLSRMLNRSSSEIFRMIDCLEKRGYIVKDELSGSYILSLKLFELAHTHNPLDQLIKAAYKPMWNLSRKIRESCHLSVLRHGKLVVLAQADSPEKLRLSVEVGAHYSMVHTVSGRLLLSYLPSEELDFLLNDQEYQMMNKAEQAELLKEFEKIRTTGQSYSENEFIKGVKNIAVLVGNPQTGPMAALAIAYLTTTKNEDDKEELIKELKSCAVTINTSIGMSTDKGMGDADYGTCFGRSKNT